MVYIDGAGKKPKLGAKEGGSEGEAVVKRGESSVGEVVRGYVREMPYLKSVLQKPDKGALCMCRVIGWEWNPR